MRLCGGEDLPAPARGAGGLCVRRPTRPSLTSRPFGVGTTAPRFAAGSPAPHEILSSRLIRRSGVTCSPVERGHRGTLRPVAASGADPSRSGAPGARAREAVALHGRALEGPLLDAELADLEHRAVAQH